MSLVNNSQSCSHMQLVRSQVAEISICPDCKVVHLTLQHLTIRLLPDAFQELAWCLGKAQSLIENKFNDTQSVSLTSEEANTLERALASFENLATDKFH